MARCALMILLVVASAAYVVGAFRAQPSSIHHRITESRPTASSSLGLRRGIIASKEGKEQRCRGDFALSFLRSDVDAAGGLLSAEVAIDIDAELAFIARRNVLLAGEEIATMETALWRWAHEEEDEEGGASTTDERTIELIANMLLERPYVSLPTTSSTHIEQEYIM